MTLATRKGGALAAAASLALLSLGACSDAVETSEAGGEPGTESIAAMIAAADELSSVEDLVEDAGLAGAFDAAPHYTVFAPTDEALGSLGEDFAGTEGRAALAAILREHVVPGYLTTEDIAAAVESGGGSVEMATMGNGTLTFTKEDDVLMVSGTGSDARSAIDGEMLGTNGVVMPVDAVLKDLMPAG